MSLHRVNYDEIAPEYDRRYNATLQDRGKALVSLARLLQAEQMLEVGCGTGHWLAALNSIVPQLYGLDLSEGMLMQAQSCDASLHLVRGMATQLPFARNWFDAVFCVDAIHHFGRSRAFIAEAYRILRPGGALAIVGSDPRHDDWYVYDYFENVCATDMARFPPREMLAEWMREEGFGEVESRVVEHIDAVRYGRQVLDDPFLRKNACSQLAMLSDDAYRAGVAKLEDTVNNAESCGETLVFRNELFIHMLVGYKPGS